MAYSHRHRVRRARQWLAGLSLSFLLAGCDLMEEDANLTAKAPATIPKAACEQIDATLRGLQNSVTVELDDPAKAVIEEANWRAMDTGTQDKVVTALAYGAACAAGRSTAEQNVTVRNEWGRTLTERPVTIDIGADLSE